MAITQVSDSFVSCVTGCDTRTQSRLPRAPIAALKFNSFRCYPRPHHINTVKQLLTAHIFTMPRSLPCHAVPQQRLSPTPTPNQVERQAHALNINTLSNQAATSKISISESRKSSESPRKDFLLPFHLQSSSSIPFRRSVSLPSSLQSPVLLL